MTEQMVLTESLVKMGRMETMVMTEQMEKIVKTALMGRMETG